MTSSIVAPPYPLESRFEQTFFIPFQTLLENASTLKMLQNCGLYPTPGDHGLNKLESTLPEYASTVHKFKLFKAYVLKGFYFVKYLQISIILYYLPLKYIVALHFYKFIPFTQYCFEPSLVEIGPYLPVIYFGERVKKFKKFTNAQTDGRWTKIDQKSSLEL